MLSVQKKIDEKFNRKSGRVFFFVDLVEEVGELAEVIRAREFMEQNQKKTLKTS